MQRQPQFWWGRAWGLYVLQLYFCPLIHLVFLRLWQLFGGQHSSVVLPPGVFLSLLGGAGGDGGEQCAEVMWVRGGAGSAWL